MSTRWTVTMALPAAILLACGADKQPDNAVTITGEIGPLGGRVEIEAAVSLECPSGAVNDPISVTITETDSDIPQGAERLTPIYRFEPDGQAFAEPCRVTFQLDGSSERGRVFWSNDAQGTYVALESAVDGDVVSASVDHFSGGFGGTPPDGFAFESFSPTQGVPGDTITLVGSRFDLVDDVLFSFVSADFTVQSDSVIVAVVPSGTTSGGISLRVGSTYFFHPDPFDTGSSLRVTDFEPEAGNPGDTVTLSGEALDLVGGVMFDYAPAEFTIDSPTTITAIVPTDAVTGPIRWWHKDSPEVSHSLPGREFRVWPQPHLVSFEPAGGAAGTDVVLTGQWLHNAAKVFFDYTETTFVVDSPTQITTVVPEGILGPVLIRMQGVHGATFTSLPPGNEFHILPPVGLESFTPTSGGIGSLVTITGRGLDKATGVYFNHLAAEFSVDSDTRISAVVPLGATTGRVELAWSGGFVSLPDGDFIVIEDLPYLASFTPVEGLADDEIVLIGGKLGSTTAVTFDDIEADFVIDGDTQVTASVPTGAATGPIGVTTTHGSFVTLEAFTVLPTIDSFEPAWGLAGDAVAITGNSLSAVDEVRFRNSVAEFTIDGPTQITAIVPTNPGTGPIRLSQGDYQVESEAEFIFVRRPSITSVEPASGPSELTTVTLTGSNLYAISEVSVGGVPIQEFTVDGGSELSFIVPRDALSGFIRVVNPAGINGSWPFTVLPRITSFAPAAGGVGTEVLIDGVNLDENEGSGGIFIRDVEVRFNGTAADFTVESASRIVATVPEGATTGPVSVAVDEHDYADVSDLDFTVIPGPVLDSFSPASGRSLVTPVTIEGSRLADTRDVTFGGVYAERDQITVESDSRITVIAPSDAKSGPIGVTTPGGTALSNDAFQLLATAEDISPRSGPVGSDVTITGRNLDEATAVTFALFTAASFEIDSPTQITAVVPDDAQNGAISVWTEGTLHQLALQPFTVASPPVVAQFDPPSGLAELTQVTVEGSRFTGASAVRFGGTDAAAFEVISDAELVATVPPNAASGAISVVTSHGEGSSDVAFRVLPQIVAFAPPDGPVGTVVTLEGQGFNDVTSVRFNWEPAAFTIDSNTQLTTTVPDGATSGPIRLDANDATIFRAEPFIVVGPPQITSFTPLATGSGGVVAIFGSELTTATSVTFNGISADFTVDSPLQITASAPRLGSSGKIQVTTAAGTAVSEADFTYLPNPESFDPERGPPGTIVSVSGDHFSNVVGVRMNGEDLAFSVIGDGDLRITIPAGATTGRLVLIASGYDTSIPRDFIVLPPPPPSITSFAPSHAEVGDFIDIYGADFTGATSLSIGGEPAASWGATGDGQLWASIAFNAVTGPIVVTTPHGSGQSEADFIVDNGLLITGFSPQRGPVGTEVTVTGEGFVEPEFVKFNGWSMFYTIDSPQQLRVTINQTVTTGPIQIRTDGGQRTTEQSFVVTNEPRIDSLSPGSGDFDTLVVIGGVNFNGATEVRLNGVSMSAVSIDNNVQIRAYVPAGATSGPITVVTPDGVAMGPADFDVFGPVVTGINPSTGPIGAAIEIAGVGLAPADRVRIDQREAVFEIVDDTTITATVPAGVIEGPVDVWDDDSGSWGRSPVKFRATDEPAVVSFEPLGGPIGQSVRIDGYSFANITAVTFGGVSASFTVNSSTVITATVPDGAHNGPIAVTNASGTGTSAESFSVTAAVTGLDPTSGPVGTEVLITGTNLSGASDVRIGGVSVPFDAAGLTEITATVVETCRTGVVQVDTPAGTAESDAAFDVEPSLLGFAPASGVVGTEVTITGYVLENATTVAFGGVLADAVVDGPGQVRAIVPDGAATGRVRVNSADGSGLSSTDFTVLRPPTIDSLSADSGVVGADIGILGANLGSATAVSFGGSASSFVVSSSSSMVATVPPDAQSGPVTVTTTDGSAQSPTLFTVLHPPRIDAFDPLRGVIGSEVTLTGAAFAGLTAVKLGDHPAAFTVISDTEVRVTVPGGASAAPFVVANTDGVDQSGDAFVVEPDVIALSPQNGQIYTDVTIGGTHLSGTTEVLLNGVGLAFSIDDDNTIRATVPLEATTGSVTVVHPDGTAESATEFVVDPATVDHFAPTIGPVGTLVVLSGSGFDAVTAVEIGGASANFAIDNNYSLRFAVPGAAVTGPISISTWQGEVTATHGFTVNTPRIDLFEPASGPPSTVVTITGEHFIDVTHVSFNGQPGPFSVDSVGQITATVPVTGASTGPVAIRRADGATAVSVDWFDVAYAPTVTGFQPTSAAPGASVTISGTRFVAVSDVRFGDIAAAFEVDLATQLRATVPQGATTAPLVVLTPEGTATSAAAFTVSSLPSIDQFVPGAAVVGSPVVVRGSNFTDATGVTFNGEPASFVADSDAQISCTVPAGASTGPISVTTPLGAGASSVDFEVLPPPECGPADEGLCPGSLLVVIATSQTIVEIDPDSGDTAVAAQGGEMVTPWDVVVDAAGDLLVADHGSGSFLELDGRIVHIDVETGDQSLITDGGLLADPEGIALDSAGRILIADAQAFELAGAVIRVDPETGAQEALSVGTNFVAPRDLVVTDDDDIYVLDHSGGVIRIDPVDGAQSVLSTSDLLRYPKAITLALDDHLIVADRGADGLIRINRATGQQTLLTASGELRDPFGVAARSDGRLFVVDLRGPVVEVNPLSGTQRLILEGQSGTRQVGVVR